VEVECWQKMLTCYYFENTLQNNAEKIGNCWSWM